MNPVPPRSNLEPTQHPRSLPQKLRRLPRRRAPHHHQPLLARQSMMQSLSRRNGRLPPLASTIQNPPPGRRPQHPNLRSIRLKPGLARKRHRIRPPRLRRPRLHLPHTSGYRPNRLFLIERPPRRLRYPSHAQFVSPRASHIPRRKNTLPRTKPNKNGPRKGRKNHNCLSRESDAAIRRCKGIG